MIEKPKRPPPPDRYFIKPGCVACEVVFGWLIITLVGLCLWMGITYYQRLNPDQPLSTITRSFDGRG